VDVVAAAGGEDDDGEGDEDGGESGEDGHGGYAGTLGGGFGEERGAGRWECGFVTHRGRF
jgi:hypothetical protein